MEKLSVDPTWPTLMLTTVAQTSVMPSSLSPPEIPSTPALRLEMDPDQTVRYISEFEVAVCTSCGYALNSSPGISRHLMTKHSWSRTEARAYEQKFLNRSIRSPSKSDDDWIIPSRGLRHLNSGMKR